MFCQDWYIQSNWQQWVGRDQMDRIVICKIKYQDIFIDMVYLLFFVHQNKDVFIQFCSF